MTGKDSKTGKSNRSVKRATTAKSEPKTPTTFGLLAGEKINFESQEDSKKITDEELNNRYVSGGVRIVTETARYPLTGILKMLEEKVSVTNSSEFEFRYKLNPDYQRRHRWSARRKSRLIESFLMNVPVPPVFIYERDLARFEVMDGRQRLTALSEFYANKFTLQGLEYWPELEGRTYATLPDKIKDGIDRRYISSIILLKETATTDAEAAVLKKMVFERLNSGGVQLSPQETRNAVYDGPLNRLCMDLSANSTFRGMWGMPNEVDPDADELDEETLERDSTSNQGKRMYEKMDDVELVLRFFAYRQIESFPQGLNRITEFLDNFLKKGNDFSGEILDEYRKLFSATIELLFELLGSEAFFRLGPDGKPGGRATKIIYDPLMYVASHYVHPPMRARLVLQREVLRSKLGAMYEQEKTLFAGRSTNSSHIQGRNQRMKDVFAATFERLGA